MFKSMQTSIKAFAGMSIVLAAFFMQSCKKADLPAEEQYSPEQIEQLRSYVAGSTGVSLDKIVYSASSHAFVVDKDGFISVKDANERYQQKEKAGVPSTTNRTSQRRYDYIVASGKTTITFYADATVPAEWLSTLDQAIANWNSTNSAIQMSRVTGTTTTSTGTKTRGKKGTTTTTTTSTPSYNVLVTTLYDASTSMIAQAYYPDYYGNAGKEVDINTYYNYLSTSNKVFAMTHELGHIVGLTHTDGGVGALIPGTPDVDANSVMNSFVLPWNGFTTWDVTAITTLYPKY
jgi:predicted Zn-dependent protease